MSDVGVTINQLRQDCLHYFFTNTAEKSEQLQTIIRLELAYYPCEFLVPDMSAFPAPRPSSNSRRRKDANGPNRGGEKASLTVRVQLRCHSPLSEEVCEDPVEDDAPTSDASAAAWRVVEETGGVVAGWVVSEGGSEVEEPWRVGSCSCGGGQWRQGR